MRRCVALALLALAVCGCGTSYSWRSTVPEGLRTIAVPTFRNESSVSELGAVATRQVLREIQREGTFAIRSADSAALEIQGVVKSTSSVVGGYSRTAAMRTVSYSLAADVEISVIDRRQGRVLLDNRIYRPQTVFTAESDLETARRDASGRLMEDLARQVVDDILNLKW